MKKLLFGVLILFSFGIMSGCATLFDSGTRTVNVLTSTGGKADVEVRSMYYEDKVRFTQIITAPTQFVVPSKHAGNLHFKVIDECYTAGEEVVHPTKIATGFWFNIIGFTGILGPLSSSTDAITGNAWTYESTVVVPATKKTDAPSICNK